MSRFRKLFAWNRWANGEALESLRRAEPQPEKAVRWLAHIVAGERLWMNRIEGAATGEVWPTLPLAQCEDELSDLAERWPLLLEGLEPDDYGRQVDYVNTRGEPWSNRLEDILMHVVLHSAYHRGQIASAVRDSGNEPAITDHVHALRAGLISG